MFERRCQGDVREEMHEEMLGRICQGGDVREEMLGRRCQEGNVR